MRERISQKMTYLGAGTGLVLFAIYGLLPGSFLGGVAGLGLAGIIFGTPVEPGIISRILVAVSMLTGVMVSGFLFVASTSVAGWLIGTVMDAMVGARKVMETVRFR
ncbi:hypothetical protein BMS3Abin07_01998 [bacterium BMS3Abin07]|nr:hypothetical protein BMS3Abin07_01998 [bacterium BMS3Abin07]GBE32443.1 hypothetical protein BMS3Bbin05_01358 [bacterium BMS3Bbin05]HDL20131.1 hypothetical protein [Nitrospirota bacterium]HDO23150.1 hypothetical protein [Nitrospirota bacterium]HDZ87767.1 hypothetical protein [Nitrospirota bacterium]